MKNVTDKTTEVDLLKLSNHLHDQEILKQIPHLEKFAPLEGITPDDCKQFAADFPRSSGILIDFNNAQYYIKPAKINGEGADELLASFKSIIESNLQEQGLTTNPLTEKQIEKIAHYFSQKYILSFSYNLLDRESIMQNNQVPVNQCPQILQLKIDEAGFMKMLYSDIWSGVNTQSEISKLINYNRFQATISKRGDFLDAKLFEQSPESARQSLLPLIMEQEPNICKNVDLDISKDYISLAIAVLKIYPEHIDRVLSFNQADYNRKNLLVPILRQTLLNPEFPRHLIAPMIEKIIFSPNLSEKRKSQILNHLKQQKDFKDHLKSAMTNLIVSYLDDNFTRIARRSESGRLCADDKKLIASNLQKMIAPVTNLSGNNKHFIDGLNFQRLVSNASREHSNLKHGFIGYIKKFCHRILDALFPSQGLVNNTSILRAFRSRRDGHLL
jgi:hypothetical protein